MLNKCLINWSFPYKRNLLLQTENTFSITYNLNGGTVTKTDVNPTSYKAGENFFKLENPRRAGYTFLGWTGSNYKNVVEAGKYEPQTTVTVTINDVGNKTYTANWIPNNYTVSFKANGGSGKMADEYFTYDLQQALSSNKFTRNNYTFKGWNTKADGNGKMYSDEQAVKNLSTKSNGNIILYAQWKKTPNNTIFNRLLKRFK